MWNTFSHKYVIRYHFFLKWFPENCLTIRQLLEKNYSRRIGIYFAACSPKLIQGVYRGIEGFRNIEIWELKEFYLF